MVGGEPMGGVHHMPTAKPRITITLEPRQHKLLTELARLQGGNASVASIIRDFLATVEAPLARILDAYRAIDRASDQVREGLSSAAARAEADLSTITDTLLRQVDWVADAIEKAAAEAPKDGEPPSCNHGGQVSTGDRS